MTDTSLEQPVPRTDVVAALRASATKGAAVPEMVAEIQTRLGQKEVITVVLHEGIFLVSARCLTDSGLALRGPDGRAD